MAAVRDVVQQASVAHVLYQVLPEDYDYHDCLLRELLQGLYLKSPYRAYL